MKLDWQQIAAQMLHPIKLEIIAALAGGLVASPVQIARMIGARTDMVDHHMHGLAAKGVVVHVATRRGARGSTQQFYALAQRPSLERAA